MEIGLNSLIEKIKKDGVEQAEKDASRLLEDAEERAREIIDNAERQKKNYIKEAETEAQTFKKVTEKALKQAARDVLLTLRMRVTEFCDRLIKQNVSAQLAPEVTKEIIVKMIENFKKDSSFQLEVVVNDKDRGKLQKAVFDTLSSEVKQRILIKGSPRVEKGFRVGDKGKDSYFDFTDEAISEAFIKYLNPKLVEVLDINLGLGEDSRDAE